MATPNSRATLIDYCKRRLGDPVIEINVDEDQLEDRVDEALQYYQEFHSDATVRTYLKHLVTATDVSNEYIPISSDIIFVSKMFPLTSSFNTSRNFFDIKYQMMLNDIADLQNFADTVGKISRQKEGYIEAGDHWSTGNIKIDLSDATGLTYHQVADISAKRTKLNKYDNFKFFPKIQITRLNRDE